MASIASKTRIVTLYMEPVSVTTQVSQTILNDIFGMLDDNQQTISNELNEGRGGGGRRQVNKK